MADAGEKIEQKTIVHKITPLKEIVIITLDNWEGEKEMDAQANASKGFDNAELRKNPIKWMQKCSEIGEEIAAILHENQITFEDWKKYVLPSVEARANF